MAKWMTKPKTGGTLQGAIEYTGDRAGESDGNSTKMKSRSLNRLRLTARL